MSKLFFTCRIKSRIVAPTIAVHIVEVPNEVVGNITKHVIELALDEKVVERMAQLFLVVNIKVGHHIARSEYGIVRVAIPLLQRHARQHGKIKQIGILVVLD